MEWSVLLVKSSAGVACNQPIGNIIRPLTRQVYIYIHISYYIFFYLYIHIYICIY